jgi:thioredoxin 2
MAYPVLIRCRSCMSVNRVPSTRLSELPICGKCKAPLEIPRTPVEVTESNFDYEVLKNPGYTLVLFWATWCGHCRGVIAALNDIAKGFTGRVKVAMVNSEKAAYLARTHNVMSVPKMVLYKNGRIVREADGAMSRTQIEYWLNSYIV